MIETFTAAIPYLLQFKYIVLFFTLFFSAAVVPISGELITIGAGALAATGGIDLSLAFIVSLSANILGDVSAYSFMRFFGNRYGSRFENKNKVLHSIGEYLRKRPVATVALSRFIGFAAGQTNFLAGFSRTPIRFFLVGDSIGNIICVAVYLVTGYVATCLGDSLTNVAAIIGSVLLFFALASFFAYLYLERESKA